MTVSSFVENLKFEIPDSILIEGQTVVERVKQG